MNLWERIKFSLSRFMYGRYGADQFSRAIIMLSLVLLILGQLTVSILLIYLSFAGYVYAIFRMFSRNIDKRAQENEAYLQKTAKWRTEYAQAKVRFRNRKQYKYFKCPQCRTRMRLTRGSGEKQITCRNCQHTFRQNA